ncbi:RecQ family ATP-dependent DNA helicase [Parasphaerochaeta coccoides]|nr:RecQ family ATP-dependent DNA helicase [Parasphaerochaeta coccoides]
MLDKSFGGIKLRPFQSLIIEDMLEAEQNDACDPGHLVILPTGGGKTLCFMLPALLMNGISIIVYPLLSLMNDQKRKMTDSPVPVFCLRGGQTYAQRDDIWRKLSHLNQAIILTNPETLVNPHVRQRLEKLDISLFVLDEAHTLIQWGNSFRPAYHDLSQTLPTLGARHVMAFTATSGDGMTGQLIASLFNRVPPHIVRADIDRPNIIYHVRRTLCPDREIVLLAAIAPRPLLVFCPTRRETWRCATEIALALPHIPVRAYHAGLGRKEREETESWFISSQDAVLCATCAFGMGVDKPNIRSVVHVRLPSTVEEYLQESGRAGRDGNTSHAWVIITGMEKPCQGYQNAFMEPHGCIRRTVLEKMGQQGTFCSGCDICDSTYVNEAEAENDILKEILWHPLRHNPDTLSAWLRANEDNWNENITDHLAGDACGAMRWTPSQAKEAVRTLIHRNRIKILHFPLLNDRIVLKH